MSSEIIITESKGSFRSILKEAINHFKRNFFVFLKFFVFCSIFNIAFTFAKKADGNIGNIEFASIGIWGSVLLNTISFFIIPIMIKTIVTGMAPRIWLIIPIIGRPEISYIRYTVLLALLCLIVPAIFYIIWVWSFSSLGGNLEVKGIGLFLAFLAFLLISIKYSLLPMFVLIEDIKAGFFQICKASSQTLKGSFVTMFSLLVVGILINVIIGFILGFTEGFFTGIMSSKGNDTSVTIILSSFLDPFIDLIPRLFACSIMAAIYLHFRERMIATVQRLQQENTKAG